MMVAEKNLFLHHPSILCCSSKHFCHSWSFQLWWRSDVMEHLLNCWMLVRHLESKVICICHNFERVEKWQGWHATNTPAEVLNWLCQPICTSSPLSILIWFRWVEQTHHAICCGLHIHSLLLWRMTMFLNSNRTYLWLLLAQLRKREFLGYNDVCTSVSQLSFDFPCLLCCLFLTVKTGIGNGSYTYPSDPKWTYL